MEIDELESPGTFADFDWLSSDVEAGGLIPLEIAFVLFTTAPRHSLTGAILWPPATSGSGSGENQDDTGD